MSKTNKNTVHKKRHGLHHKQSKRYHHVYLPYLPAAAILLFSLVISGVRVPAKSNDVLAYATEMSASNLLNLSNQKRAADAKGTLAMNSKLSAAAQAKANDMAARDYWSHNTPEGKEPWVFINNQGYSYYKAGENLAYGFATSTDTINGWMNSPAHKANLLDNEFTEVGFGYINANNYQSSGEETIVVAMYARPQTLGASSTAPAPVTAPIQSAPPKTAVVPSTANTSTATSLGEQSSAVPTNPEVAAETKTAAKNPLVINTDSPGLSAITERQVTKVAAMTDGKAPWAQFAVGIMSGIAVTVMFVTHGLKLGRFFKQGELYLLHHLPLDMTMLSLIILGAVLSQNIGTIL